MSLQAVQRATTSAEFVEWQQYIIQEDAEGFSRLDHYLAALTCEVVRARVKNPSKVKPEHYMLKFTPALPAKAQPSKKVAKARIAASKAAWGKGLGIQLP